MYTKHTTSFPLKRVMMALSLLLSFLILSVISIILYNNSRSYVQEKLDSINTGKMLQIASELDESFTQVNKLATYMQNNSQLISMVKSYEDAYSSITERVNLNNKITKMLVNIKQYNDIIEGIILVTPNGRYDSSTSYFSYDFYKKLSLEKHRDINFKYPMGGLPNTDSILNESKAIDTLDNQTYFEFCLCDEFSYYGNIFIFIKSNILIDSKEAILLIDNSSNIVYHGSSFDSKKIELIKTSIVESKKNNLLYSDKMNKIYYKKLNFNNWSLLYMVNLDAYAKQYNTLITYAVISFLFSFIITFFFSGLISSRILHPIFKLSGIMKAYRTNNIKPQNFPAVMKKSRLTMREKIFYYMLITVLVPVLSYVSIYYVQSSIITTNQVSDAFSALFDRTADKVTSYLNKKNVVLQRIIYNPIVQNNIIEETAFNDSEIEDIIEQSIYLGLDRDTFSLYNSRGKLLSTNKFKQKEYLDKSFSETVSSSFRKTAWSISNDELNRPVMTLGTTVISIQGIKNLENIGYAKIDTDCTYISELILELKSENNDVFLVDSYGNVVYNKQSGTFFNKESLVFTGSSGRNTVTTVGSKHILFYRRLEGTPWYLVSRYDWHAISQQSSFILTNNIYLFIIVLMSTTSLSYYLSVRLLAPLNTLNRLFSRYNIGRLDKRATESYFVDEINGLYTSYNKMIQRIENLIDELIVSNTRRNELEIEKKSAELSALQAQINPHFLYNTLDTIIYMVKEDLKDSAVDMIKALSNLFRYGISRGENEINLREELEYAKAYTNIMSYRYKNVIDFQWKVDESILGYKTIKLILQPVIENAIYHGIKKGSGHGIIEIECTSLENQVILSVKDNGTGIPTEQLKILREDLYANRTHNRVGIYNVQSRIRLYYGENYGLLIDSVEGEWTKVKLILPIRLESYE